MKNDLNFFEGIARKLVWLNQEANRRAVKTSKELGMQEIVQNLTDEGRSMDFILNMKSFKQMSNIIFNLQ